MHKEAVIGWVWAPSADDPAPAAEPFEVAVDADVRIGFERTIEQDIAFGIRQQVDIGTKALSPAINDPYTAVQAIDHLAVVCCDLAARPLGTKIIIGPGGKGRVLIPGRVVAEALADAERSMPRPPSLERVRAATAALRIKINSKAAAAVEKS